MVQSDIERLMEIEQECFPVPWSESAYLTEISNRSAYYIVACLDERIVGYAGMWTIMDEAHITTLGVAGSHRRQRIAEQLLIALLDEAMRRGARRATLEVRQSNEAAQALYRKYDFAPAALRRGYYTDNHENAVVMWVDNMTAPEFKARYRALKQRLARELRARAAEGVA
jgi:ribosomal-protein-alanine N-acetyltransferase